MRQERIRQAKFYSRRTMLRASCLSAIGSGIHLTENIQAVSHKPTAKSCILLFMIGGPSQQDTFDLKPNASTEIRGEFNPIATAVPGTQISEHLPKLASMADDYTLVRSMYHSGSNFHAAGVHYNLTGWPHAPRAGQPFLSRRDTPSIGSVLTQLEGRRDRQKRHALPTSIHLPMYITQDGAGTEWAGQHAGYLGQKYDPFFMDYKGEMPGGLPSDFVPSVENAGKRLNYRAKLLEALNKESGVAREESKRFQQVQNEGLSVLGDSPDWQAFCLDDEPDIMRSRYGDTHFGRSCLVARRLVEKGVRFVTVTWPITKEYTHFDTHAGNYPTMRKNLPLVDQSVSALIADLKQRGMLDETLIVYTSEFGRTPVINPNGGRDHWPNVYTTMLAGGGVRSGMVYGSSDKHAAEPKDNAVHVRDFVATIYHALGYDHNTRVTDYAGRPHFVVHGKPVRSLLR